MLLEKGESSRTPFDEVRGFREPLPFWQMALLIPTSFLWTGFVFVVAGSALVDPIRGALFS